MTGHAPRPLSDAERRDWLRLIRSENVGPVTFHHLVRHYRSAAAALDALPELSRRGGQRRPARVCSTAEADREIEATARAGARLVAAIEPDYPELLAALEDPPPVIAVMGDTALLDRPTLGMVGARNASLNGKRIAERIAADLGATGVTIVSGLARGIDTAAHRASLATGSVAVLAGGIDVCYPPENRALYDALAEQGAIVAEQATGTEPQGRHFPRRNRLISGLSLGVLVVEAAPRSGSLITARFAADQGRDVFAVPGSPLDPRCRGTNDLLRDGATLTETADDVLRVIVGPFRQAPATRNRETAPGDGIGGLVLHATAPETTVDRRPDVGADTGPDAGATDRDRVLASLSPSAVSVDELIRECQFSPSAVASILLELELAGRLERHPGNRVSLIGD